MTKGLHLIFIIYLERKLLSRHYLAHVIALLHDDYIRRWGCQLASIERVD